MSKWLGKAIGAFAGYVLTRHPMGIALGLALGHGWDQGWFGHLLPRPNTGDGALIAPLFALAGAIAKSDGRVSETEVATTEALIKRMGLVGLQRNRAIESFTRGKRSDFDSLTAARELRTFCGFRGELKLMLVEVLTELALADGELAAPARDLLLQVTRVLDLADTTLDTIVSRLRGQPRGNPDTSAGDPYVALGLTATATDREIRRAYQRLIALHHPDKLTARGADATAMAAAEVRAREINAAYERLRALRGLK